MTSFASASGLSGYRYTLNSNAHYSFVSDDDDVLNYRVDFKIEIPNNKPRAVKRLSLLAFPLTITVINKTTYRQYDIKALLMDQDHFYYYYFNKHMNQACRAGLARPHIQLLGSGSNDIKSSADINKIQYFMTHSASQDTFHFGDARLPNARQFILYPVNCKKMRSTLDEAVIKVEKL